MLYICNKAEKCKDIGCSHRKPHKLHCFYHGMDYDQCRCDSEDTCAEIDECSSDIGKVKCIPAFEDFITMKEMEI